MKLIAAVDKNWAIGNENKLLESIPADMKFFKETTTGHVVIMGRKTLESFPGGRPLKNRTNIVLTKNEEYNKDGVVVVHGIDELKEEIKKYDTDELFVIGGGSIYEALLPLCDTAHITKIDNEYKADTYFPNLDNDGNWAISYQSDMMEHNEIRYMFTTYVRI